MIKFVSNDFEDIKIGSKQVVKVMRGIDVVWEKEIKEYVVMVRNNSRKHIIGVSSSDILKTNTTYRFKTDNPADKYSINAGGKKYEIKDGDIFVTKKDYPLLSIENNFYNFFELTIYKTTSKATIIIT